MTPTFSPAVVPSAEARPVDGNERLQLLDALRGFALCGVFVSNVYMWFSLRVFTPRPQMEAAMTNASWLDTAAGFFAGIFIFGKFITLFSFLFGLGFAVQMGRAEARGASIVPLYVRRLTAMLLIGFAHLSLLWYGDILSTYAVLGFGLLLFRKREDGTALKWATGFILVSPVVILALTQLPDLLAGPAAMAAAAKEEGARQAASSAELFQVFSHGGYFDVVRANLSFYFGHMVRMSAVVMLALLGRFLVGLVAGRRRLFHDAASHLPLFRRVLLWALPFGLVGSSSGVVIKQLVMHHVLPQTPPAWLPYVLFPVRQMGEVGLAAVYVSGFVLLFQRPLWQRILSVLAPVGRMALTNYLSQTVMSLLMYYGYGLGLGGKLGPAALIGLPVAIFCVQIVWSHLWLARFRFGPAEWLWRSMTYGKLQPMRNAPAPQAVSIAAA